METHTHILQEHSFKISCRTKNGWFVFFKTVRKNMCEDSKSGLKKKHRSTINEALN